MIENTLSTATTVGEARAILLHHLGDTLEIDHLLCATLRCERSRLYAHRQMKISRADRLHLQTRLQRRLQGVPLAYVTGSCEFFSLELEITPDALIPRPATETLVEAALATMKQQARVLELGTGCGAVAITLAQQRPDATITACDISTDALALAQRNAKRHGVEVKYIESDWFNNLADQRFDLIVANPPYLDEQDPEVDPSVLAHEPRVALVARERGLACLHRIIADAPAHLYTPGALVLEHGYSQTTQVRKRLAAAGFSRLRCTRDLAGHPRVATGTKMPGRQTQ